MIKIIREELYEKVWSQPITHIAKVYGVSDSAIIKICKKMEVPRPGLGHWAKVEFGKPVKKVKLTKLTKEGASEYFLSPTGGNSSTQSYEGYEEHTLIRFEKDEANQILVEKNVIEPHPFFVRNQKSFRNARADEKQILHPRAKVHFDLKVSDASLGRALVIMDALLKAFVVRGWDFKFKADQKLKMIVSISNEEIEFSINEKTKQIDHVLTKKEKSDKAADRYYWGPKYDHVPTGQLTLKIENPRWLISRHSWSDGKVQRVENCLNKFCISAIELAEAIKVDRAKKKSDEIRRREEETERMKLRDLRDEELKKREIFEKQIKAWEKAEKCRRFIESVSLIDGEVILIGKEEISKQKWLDWANNYANIVDPLKKGEDTIVEKTENMFRHLW